MALSSTFLGKGTSSSGTSVVCTPTTYPSAAGTLLVLVMAYDNSGSNGADPGVSSIVDSQGNTWTSRHNTLRDPSSAASGTVLRIWTTRQDVGRLVSANTITVTLGAAAVKVWVLWEITAGAGNYADFLATGTGAGGASTTPSVTTGTIVVGDMTIGGVAYEYGANDPTGDSDANNGSWSTQQTTRTGSTTSGQSVASQTKVQATADSTQTYNVTYTNSSDWACGWISVREYAAWTTVNVPDAASATGAALAAIISVVVFAGVASATGAANQPTAQVLSSVNASAGVASAVGASYDAVTRVVTLPAAASATGSANQPTAQSFVVTNANAGVATGTGAAEWGGGSSTVGSDSFTEASTVALTSHTAETGGTWSPWAYDGMSLYVDGAGDYVYTANPDDATWHTNITKLGSVSVGDGYVQARVTLSATSGGVVARTVGTNNAYLAVEDTAILGAGTYLKLLRLTAGAFTELATGTAVASPRTVKLDVSGSSPTVLKVRAWDVTEGGTWDIDTSDNTAGNQAASGGVGILASGYNDSYGSGDQPTYIDSFSAVSAGGGAAVGPTVTVINMAAPAPAAATAVGTANAPVPQVRVSGGLASATGTAYTASVTTFSGTSVDAGVASGTGTAPQPTASPATMPGVGSGTGTAPQLAAHVRASGGVASGTGTASQPSSQVRASAGVASGTGTAPAAFVAIGAMAGAATATGVANDVTVTISGATNANAGVASGTGTASQPGAQVRVTSGYATAAGTAPQPTYGIGVTPSAASGTGTALGPVVALRVGAALASGTGTAWDASVSSFPSFLASAGLASANGAAWDATVTASSTSGGAGPTGSGVAPFPAFAHVGLAIAGSSSSGIPSGAVGSRLPTGTARNVRPT